MLPLILLLLQGMTVAKSAPNADDEFVVWSNKTGFIQPLIVVQFHPENGTGIDWSKADKRPWHDSSNPAQVGSAVNFLREGIEKICGQRLDVKNSNDLSRGIVLTTLAGATDDIRKDAEVQKALKNDGSDAYNDREAYFIRSEQDRLLIVANTAQGLVVAVPALLESVGYEILGMGPNWIHVPEKGRDRLVFHIKQAGRPGYYLRGLNATSGQGYGMGTIMDPKLLSDPSDETVDISYRRWILGRRTMTRSMPYFPGHALQGYHRKVVAHIRNTGDTDGFLGTVKLGQDSERPQASDANRRWLWINTDLKGQPKNGLVFHSTGKEWKQANLASLPRNLDLSVPAVRTIILDNLKRKSDLFFEKSPDSVFVFGTDPEDGSGYAQFAQLLKNPQWYPQYLAKAGVKFGKPYLLHNFNGLDQPREQWDPSAPSDTVYGFNNWLLREYDRWIDSRPELERVTTTGQSRKGAIRCSFYCYNYHDVPPNFNPDPRIRVMIASYPKHRGRGKWKAFASQMDLARAFRVLLPREPSGDYWIISLSYFSDATLDGLKPRWDASPQFLAKRQQEHYDAGFRALNMEMDYNFGRLGLGYYLISKLLWNPHLSSDELDVIRDRWLQRAYGSGWKPMKEYYDFLLPANYPVNSPHAWSQAIRMIEAADKLIDPAKEPAAQRRLDDLKQYWYFYYLVETGQNKTSSPAMRALLWKGQMSYMNAMHMVSRRVFGTRKVAEAVSEFQNSPAHFTADETAQWWEKILDHWKIIPVTRFDKATLANGRKGSDIDLNDLVSVTDFGSEPSRQGFIYNSGYMPAPTFLCVASNSDEEIGFQLYWPADPTGKDRFYIARDVSYGIDCWNTQTKTWDELVDKTMTVQPSKLIQIPGNKKQHHLATVRYRVAQPGTYRFEISRGGNLAFLTDLSWNPKTNQHAGGRSLAFDGTAIGLTQRPTFIYIPKGTKSLDLEVWDSYNRKYVTLYQSLSPSRGTLSRKVDISARQTHRITLKPEETGTIAEISGNGFAFPTLYSVPMLWAKSPSQLVVPRAIVEADGLTERKN